MSQKVYQEWKGKPIVIYKAKSGGIVLGSFECPYEFVELEKKYRENSVNGKASLIAHVLKQLKGQTKYMNSFYYQSKISIKLKKQQ